MKRLAALMLACTVAGPAIAEETCPQDRAIYTEKYNGYVLSFRPPERWEGWGNTTAILDLAFPDGTTHVWGWTYLPNGTSHDRMEFFTDACRLESFDPEVDIDPKPGSTEEELEACSVWKGVVLALANDDISALPWFDDEPAAETIILPNLGPTVRYSGLVLGPGDEPHDVFTLDRCRE